MSKKITKLIIAPENPRNEHETSIKPVNKTETETEKPQTSLRINF